LNKLPFTARKKRVRKAWTFEKLEDRHVFSATPIIAAPEVTSLSSNSPDGLQAILARELEWAIREYANKQLSNAARTGALNAIPNDPYFQYQWHLFNTGQLVGSPDFQDIFGKPGEDINVLPVWDRGYTGEGVVVAVVDSGTQTNHPDLAANINLALQFNALNGQANANPDLLDPTNAHGNAVAGLIAAVGNNGIGTTGVAYNAEIVPIRLIDSLFPVPLGGPEYVNAFRHQNQVIDIYNHSWGPADDATRLVYSMSPLELAALRDSVIFGRGGLGNIHVFAAGNDAGPTLSAAFPFTLGDWDSAGYNGFVNSRYTIGVGGIDHDGSYNNIDGTVTSYPEAGGSILVAAPTGSFPISVLDDFFVGSGVWTTDAMGDDGFNIAPLPNGDEIDLPRDFFEDTDYTSRFNGTSAAAPLVSGVIALMLEANPQLTWRDVKEILVRSARQAGQFEQPATGGGLNNLNSWIVNPHPFFYNPDPFVVDPAFNPTSAQISPANFVALNQAGLGATGFLLNYDSYKPPRPTQFANGAGYTVSRGIGVYGEQFGYGHGVVDAELAVLLAEQWHEKDQNLPPELTFTTFIRQPALAIAAGQLGNPATGQLLIPGSLGGSPSVAYWNEYFDMEPFDPNYTTPFGVNRGGYLHFEVPDSNAMAIEHLEVRFDLNVAGGDAGVNAYDSLRITLVSPNGTVSELNHYHDFALGGGRQSPTISPLIVDPPGSITAVGNLTYTFSSNRNWGERYDTQYVIDPATGNPFLDSLGGAVQQGWELHIENYSGTTFTLTGLEIAWHGRPIDAASQRVQGSIGIDGGRFGVGANDDFFNFDRYFQTIVDNDLDGVVDFNEAVRTADPFQEEFAANITVQAKRVSDGVVVAEFVTGADGNFYFDLIPDEYIISIVDPEERTAKNEPGVPVGTLAHYQSEWHITPDWFFVPEIDSSDPTDFRVMVGGNGVPVAWQDAINPPLAAGIKNINFLLDPGPVPPNQVVVSGQVFADVSPAAGDGQFNGDDVGAPGFVVFADTNKSGQFEATDTFVLSDATGNYSLTVLTTEPNRFTIGALPLNGSWTAISPSTQSVVGFPGDVIGGINFAFRPTNGSGNASGNVDGSILGVVFQDQNGDGVRQTFELGLANQTVFVDLNSDGLWDDQTEPSAVTNAAGAYFLADVGPGTVRVDVVAPDNWVVTAPTAGFRNVNLLSDGTATNILFGLRNAATADYGDLAGYPTTPAENGPSHTIVAGFQLGSKIDGELATNVANIVNADATGDDLNGMDDEDGVVIVGNGGQIVVGANTLRVTVQGVGGSLQGWIDWNNDGDWDDAGERVFNNVDLSAGTHDLIVTAPPSLAGGPLAARFRWGSQNIGYLGADTIGEVEDYRLANSLPPMSSVNLPGDFNRDTIVNRADYSLWKSTFGSTSDLRADGNGDGRVNAADYTVWRNNEGATASASGASLLGLQGGTVTTPTDPAAARAAARARALAGLGDLNAPLSIAPSADATARLLAAGALPITIRVGNGTQTVYYFPDPATAASATGGLAVTSTTAVSPQRVDLSGLQFAFTADSGSEAIASPLSTPAGNPIDFAAMQLLDQAWVAIGEDDANEDDQSLALASSDEPDQEVAELALAALFEENGDWLGGI
jgi:subtilisin family serine protease